MHISIKITIVSLGIIFVGAVVYLLVRRKINERNSLLWLAGALAILLLSVIPDVLEITANAIGVDYPPTLLFVLSTLVILLILLYQSIQISILQDKCRELAQRLAIINFNHEKLTGPCFQNEPDKGEVSPADYEFFNSHS